MGEWTPTFMCTVGLASITERQSEKGDVTGQFETNSALQVKQLTASFYKFACSFRIPTVIEINWFLSRRYSILWVRSNHTIWATTIDMCLKDIPIDMSLKQYVWPGSSVMQSLM